MRFPGIEYVGVERREATPAEREEYRMANGGGNGGGHKVVISPVALGTLIVTLVGGAGYSGFAARVAPTQLDPHMQADHDQITEMSVELRTLKEKVDKIDQRSEETNSLVKRLYYSSSKRSTVDAHDMPAPAPTP
jgi:hypothetical protein